MGSTPFISSESHSGGGCGPSGRRSLGTLTSLMLVVDIQGQAYTYDWAQRKLTAEQRVGLRLLVLSEGEGEELGGRLVEVCALQADRESVPLGSVDGWRHSGRR